MLFEPVGILARTIYGEARGQGVAGMSAIASVVMNRVNNPGWWGTNVIFVCLDDWQFSCWNNGDPNRKFIVAALETDLIFASAISIATKAVNGTLADSTNGADSYYAESLAIPPIWANGLVPTAVIGGQRFYQTKSPLSQKVS